jgi:Na+/citrate or Na+/malate symporter
MTSRQPFLECGARSRSLARDAARDAAPGSRWRIDRPFFNRRIFDVAQPVFEICEAVLAVSFLSLGLRPGLVVALAIPLVLAMTFVALGITDPGYNFGAREAICLRSEPGWR